MGRHRRAHRRGRVTGRAAISLAALGFGALQLGGVATAAPAGTAGGDGGGVGGTSCTNPAIKACVDLSMDQAWLLDGNGNVVYGGVPTTHGTDDLPTPTGDYAVQWKDADHYTSEYNDAPMPYSVFFDTNGRAFHAGSLERSSAGCVHLSMDDAKRFFDFLNPGDAVQIVP